VPYVLSSFGQAVSPGSGDAGVGAGHRAAQAGSFTFGYAPRRGLFGRIADRAKAIGHATFGALAVSTAKQTPPAPVIIRASKPPAPVIIRGRAQPPAPVIVGPSQPPAPVIVGPSSNMKTPPQWGTQLVGQFTKGLAARAKDALKAATKVSKKGGAGYVTTKDGMECNCQPAAGSPPAPVIVGATQIPPVIGGKYKSALPPKNVTLTPFVKPASPPPPVVVQTPNGIAATKNGVTCDCRCPECTPPAPVVVQGQAVNGQAQVQGTNGQSQGMNIGTQITGTTSMGTQITQRPGMLSTPTNSRPTLSARPVTGYGYVLSPVNMVGSGI
jgi:hypothetical protein